MNISVFVAILPVVLGFSYSPVDDEVDIYPYIIADLRKLKLRELAENSGASPQAADSKVVSVCYDELGCFDTNGTFKHLKQLPDTPENIATRFLLYTRRNKHMPNLLDYRKPETIHNSNIDPNLPLKFIVHGFGGKNNITWVWNMKNTFLEKEDLNVIAVDWSKGAAIPHYIEAAVNAELVGAQIAALYFVIKDEIGIPEEKLHVIGFSLGAHVSGFVGKRMKVMRGSKPGRITGLDPASPLYEDYGGNVHLFKDDASFVDVIHTNADLLIYGGVGIGAAIGHVDYYPNGGIRQPGCPSTLKGAFLDLLMKGKRDRVCNHERAVHLFTESIAQPNSCMFASYPCNDFEEFSTGECLRCEAEYCGIMGYKPLGTGIHYLLTDEKSPYCADTALMSVQFSAKNKKKSYGSLILTLVSDYGDKLNVTIAKKDDKLMPSAEKTLLVALNYKMKSVREVHAIYTKYDGWMWIRKGTEEFVLGSLKIKDSKGTPVFTSCKDYELLSDKLTVITDSGESC